MNPIIFKAMFWKEWQESRVRARVLLYSFVVPLVFFILEAVFGKGTPFTFGLMDHASPFGIPYFLFLYVITFGLLLIGLFAGRSMGPELEDHRIFFLFDRPIRRHQILAVKYLVGTLQVAATVGFSFLISLIYTEVFWLGTAFPNSNVPLKLLWRNAGLALRWDVGLATTAILFGLLIYSATLFFSVLFEKRWWGESIGFMLLIVLLSYSNRMDQVALNFPGGRVPLYLVGGSVWGKYLRILLPDLTLPSVFVFILVIASFFLATCFCLERKELK